MKRVSWPMKALLTAIFACMAVFAISSTEASAQLRPAKPSVGEETSTLHQVHRRRWHRHRHYHRYDYDDDYYGGYYSGWNYPYYRRHRREVYVGAPFARVYSGRRGVHVRAPFVNLWIPRRRWGW